MSFATLGEVGILGLSQPLQLGPTDLSLLTPSLAHTGIPRLLHRQSKKGCPTQQSDKVSPDHLTLSKELSGAQMFDTSLN